ncbi:hypothetical protein Hanom_Chr04g00308071 [Helianthus anomalus]
MIYHQKSSKICIIYKHKDLFSDLHFVSPIFRSSENRIKRNPQSNLVFKSIIQDLKPNLVKKIFIVDDGSTLEP